MFTLINTARLTVSLKHPAGWCWFLHSNEGRIRVVQIGPLIVEVISAASE